MASRKHANVPATPEEVPQQESKDNKAGHNKGLRQFSRQVWMKVMEKKKTTYNEVSKKIKQKMAVRKKVSENDSV